ncbi:MAG: hypothetical protein C3F13_17835 [Anaerolineales bacterium]|nr:MAG: hypothetical protein C3F13_17835 [Anaerolineales bacterium]
MNCTQWLSRDELEALQHDKLLRLVEYANQYIPYYQRIFKEIGFQPGDLEPDLSNLDTLPVLTKALIRDNYQDLITTEPERRHQMSQLATSGSTGEPLTFMQDNNFRDVVTADIQRHISWAGWQLGDSQAFIWGAKLDPTIRQRLRLAWIDRVWNRFQMDAFALSPSAMQAFACQTLRSNARILFGYPTSIQVFARYVRSNLFDGVTFDGVFTTAERLLPVVRQEIEEIFHTRVFNRYGTLELGGIACECESHLGLHVSVENNLVEILVDGAPSDLGQVGEVVVTNLNNYGMPFIRYQVGDFASFSAESSCPCGRSAPMLASVEGRSVEALRAANGSMVWGGFAGAPWRCLTHPSIRQFQVNQKSLKQMVFRLVPSGEIPRAVLDEIRYAVRHTFGDNCTVEFKFVDEIAPLPSGKHQYAVSELNEP